MIDINSDNYIDKYIDILDLFCCVPDVLCNNLSYNKNAFCKKCIDLNITNKTKKELFLEKKHIISQSIRDLLCECEKTIGKINKVGVIIKIFETIYYNIFFIIIHPKLLITIKNKIDEFINNNDTEYFVEYIKYNKDKDYIYNFMLNIINYVKINNYNLSLDMHQEEYDIFLYNFVNHIKINYENMIDEHNNSIKKIEQCDFNINFIEKYSFYLDI